MREEEPQSSEASNQPPATTRPVTPPAEGERRAQRGYGQQYESAAAAIYAALDRGDLLWVGLADRSAGIADDVVLGLPGSVVGHQFKTAQFPGRFTLDTLLMGANGLLRPLADAWLSLRATNLGEAVEIRLVTNDYPSTSDTVGIGAAGHSAAFLAEFEEHPNRSLAEWRASRWQAFVDRLCQTSRLDEATFEQFLRGFRLLHGTAADFVQFHRLSSEGARLAREIAQLLPRLVADRRNKDRWSRLELLHELGWRDSAITRHGHLFPVGAHVQRNVDTEAALRHAIQQADRGYVSLVGPPGAGKSTLLQTSLATETGVLVVRYLAYVPGLGQGLGRGEANDFLEDIATQLKNSGLVGVRFRNETLVERREEFEALLQKAGARFERQQIRTLIVIDGLDHVPREERPERSFLAELPLPESVPPGVLLVLGTQRLDLQDLKPAVRSQADADDRKVSVSPLRREAVHRMADLLALDPEISRDRIFELSHGHPLVTRYLIEALRDADETGRADLLAGAMQFEGDIETVYESAWRGISEDPDACDVLGYIARAEGPIPLELLATVIPEQAIERALKTTRHLLTDGSLGWSVFHNSFRLFVLEKPRLRLGKQDTGYSAQVYRALAGLARTAPADTPQRWLELRYLARAEEHGPVRDLAVPARFRDQLAEGRPFSEIQADIRLALAAATDAYDTTLVVRLVLARDEIARRSMAMEEAPGLTDALLAVGDLNAAEAFVQEYRTGGYKVVDALLAAGEHARAKSLFETLEPLQQLLAGRLDNHGFDHNQAEFSQWARRVFHFRDIEQIKLATERLSSLGLERYAAEDRAAAADEVIANLRYEVVLAILASRPDTNAVEIGRELDLDVQLLPDLLVHAGLRAHKLGSRSQSMALLKEAAGHERFLEVPNAWRRNVALLAADWGEMDMARFTFDGLTPPAIADLDDQTDDGVPEHLARAVMEHAQLAARLGRPLASVAAAKRPLLRPLQLHANVIGTLLGRAQLGENGLSQGEVVRAARAALAYLSQASPHGGDDFFAMRQVILATPVLGRALVRTAALSGEEEFANVLAELDRAFEGPDDRGGIRSNMRREVAVAIYRANGDMQGASLRLEPLVAMLRADTPSMQLDGLAALAVGFTQVGNHARAKELLGLVPSESLGYALPPKKDPQYATWTELLVRANAADPARRPQRVAFLMRQVSGMKHTEGRSAAYRIAWQLISEAAMHDPPTGLAAARLLADNGMIAWPNLVDALLMGLVKRRPDLCQVCVIAWNALALPYYREPSFRESHLGEFVESAIAAAVGGEVAELVEIFRAAIEAESRNHERSTLLGKLRAAAQNRNCFNPALDDAQQRWAAESPAPRHSYTPQKYDPVNSLADLQAAFEREVDPDSPGYQAPRAFKRLAAAAGFEAARAVFERWPVLQQDSGSRFMVVDLAIDAGDDDYARRLVAAYEAQPDERASWTEWTGGGSLRNFRAKIRLDGVAVHLQAYSDLVSSLAGNRESIQSVLMEIEDILPVISATPDWVAVWDWLVEQLATTREQRLGEVFNVVGTIASDEELVAALFRWALTIPLGELQQQVRLGIQRLNAVGSGSSVSLAFLRALLGGNADEPAQALQLLLLDSSDTHDATLGQEISGLVDHPDYAVAEAAALVSLRWGRQALMTRSALPPFYQFILEEVQDASEAPLLADSNSGAMRVENPLGWTSMFPTLVNALARQGVTEQHVRHRSRMFIEQWGGLDTFGRTATQRLQGRLGGLEMRILFHRPHVMAGARALRYVAGELRRAGMIGAHEVPFLLHLMNFPAPPLPLVAPVPRPTFLRRPALDETGWRKREEDEQWIRDVADDVGPLRSAGDKVIAEISTFKVYKVRRMRYRVERIRAPHLEVGSLQDLDEWADILPKAMWAGGFRALTNEAAPTIVRRLRSIYMPDVPRYQLILCPIWVARLGWHSHPDNWLVYLDGAGQVVARVVFWRDGGPVDIEDDAIWAEGVYVTVTAAGLTQLERAAGALPIFVHAQRRAEPRPDTDDVLTASAVGRD